MAPDDLDLVLRVEDEFSIYISDDEVTAIHLAGDIYRLVLGKLEPSASCLGGRAFSRTRKALAGALGTHPLPPPAPPDPSEAAGATARATLEVYRRVLAARSGFRGLRPGSK